MSYSKTSLLVRIAPLIIAVVSFAWNIYKIFMKLRLRISLSITTNDLMITATNFGPGKITLQNTIVIKYIKRNEYINRAPINLIQRVISEYAAKRHQAPLLIRPQALDAGEEETFRISIKEVTFIKKPYSLNIVQLDSTGRIYWATNKSFKKIKIEYKNLLEQDHHEPN